MKSSFPFHLGAAMALAAAASMAPHPADDIIRTPRRKATPYQRPAPTMQHDHARLEAAERKRARKAARLAALVARGGLT